MIIVSTIAIHNKIIVVMDNVIPKVLEKVCTVAVVPVLIDIAIYTQSVCLDFSANRLLLLPYNGMSH